MIVDGLPSRRAAIRLSIAGTLAGGLTFGCGKSSSQAEQALTVDERETLGAVADTLVPSSAAAGVADFVAAMLAEPDPRLCYRFVSFPIPPRAFYKLALASFDDLSHAMMGRPLNALPPSERLRVVENSSNRMSTAGRGRQRRWFISSCEAMPSTRFMVCRKPTHVSIFPTWRISNRRDHGDD